MPDNQSHLQADAHLPRAVVSHLPQNVQNTWSDGGQGMDDPSTSHYGSADAGDK
jgi:hypothetical protein